MITAAKILGITSACIIIGNGIHDLLMGTGDMISFIIVLMFALIGAFSSTIIDSADNYYIPGIDEMPADGHVFGILIILFTAIYWYMVEPKGFFVIGPVLMILNGIIVFFQGPNNIPYHPNNRNGRHVD